MKDRNGRANFQRKVGIVTYRSPKDQFQKLSREVKDLEKKGIEFVLYDRFDSDDSKYRYKIEELKPKLNELNMIYVYNLAIVEDRLGGICPKKVANLACSCHLDTQNREYRRIKVACRMPNGLYKVIEDLENVFHLNILRGKSIR